MSVSARLSPHILSRLHELVASGDCRNDPVTPSRFAHVTANVLASSCAGRPQPGRLGPAG